MKYLKRHPVTVAFQIEYIFRQVWGKVLPSDIHPIGQILNFDDWGEYQGRATEHFHDPIYVADAPKIDKNTDKKVGTIDRYITCFLPALTVQTHSHTKTCLKKKGVICRIVAPWQVTERAFMICRNSNLDNNIRKKSK